MEPNCFYFFKLAQKNRALGQFFYLPPKLELFIPNWVSKFVSSTVTF